MSAPANAPELLRRLTVDVRIEAQTADDSYLSPLVAEALQEFIGSPGGTGEGHDAMHGKFESKDGVDVTWRAVNEYFENGVPVLDMGQAFAKGTAPIPLTIGHLEHAADGGECLVIDGVRYSLAVFKTLAHPDPAKRYSFVRQGDTVTLVERP